MTAFTARHVNHRFHAYVNSEILLKSTNQFTPTNGPPNVKKSITFAPQVSQTPPPRHTPTQCRLSPFPSWILFWFLGTHRTCCENAFCYGLFCLAMPSFSVSLCLCLSLSLYLCLCLSLSIIYIYICRGVGMGKQVGSMDEESQVRGCYNITFICTPTNQETVSALH